MIWSNVLLFIIYFVCISIGAPSMLWQSAAFAALALTVPGAFVIALVKAGKI